MASMMVKGDIGTIIKLDTDIDVSAAIDSRIDYKKPNGDTGSWTASTSTTFVQYTLTSGDLDMVGKWELQAYVDLTTWQGRSSIVTIPVGEQLV